MQEKIYILVWAQEYEGEKVFGAFSSLESLREGVAKLGESYDDLDSFYFYEMEEGKVFSSLMDEDGLSPVSSL